MVLRRGLDGKLRVSYWVKDIALMLLVLALLVAPVIGVITNYLDKVDACDARGGVWVGGAIAGGHCVEKEDVRNEWN